MADTIQGLSNALGDEGNDEQISTQSEGVTQQSAEPSKIKLGETEYSQEELNRLVGLGRLAEEAEKKYNTKIDKVWPEYGRTKQREKELENEIEKLRNPQPKVAESEADAIKEAKDAARKLGIVIDEDFDSRLQKSFRTYYQQERAAEKLLEDAKDMESEIDGKDGRPAFKTQEVLEFMAENGINNLETAYKVKYEKELDSWKESQLGKAKRSGMTTTIQGSGAGVSKQPSNVKITRDNLSQLVSEALEGKF